MKIPVSLLPLWSLLSDTGQRREQSACRTQIERLCKHRNRLSLLKTRVEAAPAAPFKTLPRNLAVGVLFNTAIATGLTLVRGGGFFPSIVYSQCIGLAILLIVDGVRRVIWGMTVPPIAPMVALSASGIVTGFLIGTTLAILLVGAPAKAYGYSALHDRVSLAVTVTGNPAFVYQWYQGTTKLTDVAGNISGSTTGALTLTNAQVANSGNYTVVVTNNYGSVTSAVAVVSITPSPDIVIQPPSNTVVYAGNQLTFSITVVGATPLSYRWYKGTSPIGGATTSRAHTALLSQSVRFTTTRMPSSSGQALTEFSRHDTCVPSPSAVTRSPV